MSLPHAPILSHTRNRYGLDAKALLPDEIVIALAGNPNVGKSTVFNGLTGLKQHTGNWPGKTVSNAQGKYRHKDSPFLLTDLPGTYSLMANSQEEEIARNFICFGEPHVTVIVADATCLERNLNLVLQVLEITDKAVLCVNLMDEAKKKKISVDISMLSNKLGIPVISASARDGKGLKQLMDAVYDVSRELYTASPLRISYREEIEHAVSIFEPSLKNVLPKELNSRWTALRLLDGEESILRALHDYLGYDVLGEKGVREKLEQASGYLLSCGITKESIRDEIISSIVRCCENIAREAVTLKDKQYHARDRRIDRILTSRATGIPIMILLFFIIFWITIAGANAPSALLSDGLFSLIEPAKNFLFSISFPAWLVGLLVDGMYKTLAWVVSVMLPPMAIFFPLFTLLEDLGYLPRIAFNLDNFFRKANAHGKQALTMCMGFGCNACGVTGCRIIDSPRERLIAVLTNNFVPCNGRFPTLIAVITMFFAAAGGLAGMASSTVLLTGVVVLGVLMTLAVSKALSKTLLKGVPSSFQLELPPYRRPQIGKVIVRSVLDRTLFVLGRAVMVAAPAGLVIWLMANLKIGDISILAHCAAFLDPFARLMGLDGYILTAFILGFPANEIVIPILLMSYLSTGSLTEFESLAQLHALLVSHGWTWLTAVCVMLFSLMHWPCGTTLITIRKETKSAKWTLAAFLIPTAAGIAACMLLTCFVRLLGLV